MTDFQQSVTGKAVKMLNALNQLHTQRKAEGADPRELEAINATIMSLPIGSLSTLYDILQSL